MKLVTHTSCFLYIWILRLVKQMTLFTILHFIENLILKNNEFKGVLPQEIGEMSKLGKC